MAACGGIGAPPSELGTIPYEPGSTGPAGSDRPLPTATTATTDATSRPNVSPGAEHDFEHAYGEPDPVDVTVELSPITFTSPVSVEHGGLLSLAGQDGTFYQLDVPPAAVVSDVEVTMTIVSSISGSPLGDQLVGAVQLEPQGLRFLQPATLTITPAVPIAIDEEGPFSADSDGRDFHLFPLDPDPSVLRMHVLHFSIFGLFKTDIERRAEMIRKTARSVEAQLQQEIAAEAEKARRGDGSLDRAAADVRFDYYRDRVIRPMMALAENDHTLFREAWEKWVSWQRQRELLGMPPQEDERLHASFLRAFRNYVEHVIERCYRHDLSSVIELLSFVRADQLLGGALGVDQGALIDQINKCGTFTLEMDSTMEADLNTCMFLDAGASSVSDEARVTTAVEISYTRPAPWAAPMIWESASYEAKCRLPAQGGGNIIECQMSFAGFADAGEFAVVKLDFDLNFIKPRTGGEATAEMKIKEVLVQPGDPQIMYDGDCSILGFSGGSEVSKGSGGWLAGWKDNTAPAGRELRDDPTFGEVYALTGWEFVGQGDEIARREYDASTDSVFGTTSEETTFVLRHTPRR